MHAHYAALLSVRLGCAGPETTVAAAAKDVTALDDMETPSDAASENEDAAKDELALGPCSA